MLFNDVKANKTGGGGRFPPGGGGGGSGGGDGNIVGGGLGDGATKNVLQLAAAEALKSAQGTDGKLTPTTTGLTPPRSPKPKTGGGRTIIQQIPVRNVERNEGEEELAAHFIQHKASERVRRKSGGG